MKKETNFIVLGFVLVFLSLGMVSANVLIAGTVYYENLINTSAGVGVTVICDSNSLDTTSENDGSYAVKFGVDSCGSVEVIPATGYKTTNLKITVESDTPNPEPPQTTSSGGSGGGMTRTVYKCGNGKCDSGETSSTCLKDCPVAVVETPASETPAEELIENQETTDNSETDEEYPPRITGSTIGERLGGNKFLFLTAMILVIVIAIGLVITALIRSKNSIPTMHY